ncbi:MAG: hypothetical protein PVH95_00260 [Anaerolineae bacterium]
MIKPVPMLVALCMLAGLLAACGGTPEPTAPPPTQTPWIVVVTATPEAGDVAEVQPTQTPWIIVATATATRGVQSATAAPTAAGATEDPTATVAATSEPPPPTDTPNAEELEYPAPALLEPPDDRPVSWQSTVIFEWSSVGALGVDEYYHLHLERRPTTEGEQWYGDYVYTKATSFLAETSFLSPFHPPADRGPTTVYWWVRVVRKTGEDESGKPVGVDIGQHSEEGTLVLEPKPD